MQGNHWVPWIHWTESHQFCGNKWYFLVNVGVALGNLLRCYLLPLLLSRFSRVRLCATPWTAAHQAPPSPGFSRQEHWSGLPFPSPMHESEKWKWSRSVMSNSSWPHGLQPTRLLRPWDFPGKSAGVGCHRLLQHCVQLVELLYCSEVSYNFPYLDAHSGSKTFKMVWHESYKFCQMTLCVRTFTRLS